jgi:hypothetical protein
VQFVELFGRNLLPIFLAAGAGWGLAVWKKVPAQPISRVGFFIFSPCLIYTLITQSSVSPGDFAKIAGFTVVTLGITASLALLVSQLLGHSRPLKAAIFLVVLLPNAGSYGMSANLFAFGDDAMARAGVVFITMSILAYTVGVFVASMGKASVGQALRKLLGVPAIWAVPFALLMAGTGSKLPVPLDRTVNIFAQAAIPTFLVILGMQLRHASARHHPRALGTVVVFRMLVGVLVGFGVAKLFGLQGVGYQATMLEMGMPCAIINTIIATEYDAEPSFVATAVFTTMLVSPLTLTPLLWWLGA